MADWFGGTSVNLLTGADFDDVEPWKLRNKRCAFVLFFANWCGHCQNLKPEYIKFADIAQFIKVFAVDTEQEATLMERLGKKESPVQIEGYPTIWIYCNGLPTAEYSGERNVSGLIKEARKVCKEICKCDQC